MPATDNKYPITYDGVDPLTILPSLNPYEGYPIKRISASQNLSVIAIIKGDDEHPYLSSIPATPILLKANYSTGNKTGFFVPSSSFARGYHFTSTAVGSASSTQLSGYINGTDATFGQIQPGYVAKPRTSVYGGGVSRLASLDDVFYNRYIKNYLGQISAPAAEIPVGVYSIPGGIEFLGTYPYEVGPAPSINNLITTNVFTQKSVIAYLGGFSQYGKWTPGPSTAVTSFLTSNDRNYVPTQNTQKYGAVEGWHTVISRHELYVSERSNTSTYWSSQFDSTAVHGQKYYTDTFLKLGNIDNAAPSQITTALDGLSSWIFLCYSMPQRPATDFSVYKKSGVSYQQETPELENELIGQSREIQIAKEVSVSPDGNYLLIATDTQSTGYTTPRLPAETIILFRRGFVLGSTIWRNAFLSSGNFPASSEVAIKVSSEFTTPATGNWTQNPVTAGVDNPLNYGQFNSVAVSNNADWVVGNNYGYTRKSLSTGSYSLLQSDVHAIIPSAPRAISRNLTHVQTPTPGSEYGNAGSPTIAMAVSNNGVVVKSERVVPGRFPYVRLPIVALVGSDFIDVTFPDGESRDAAKVAAGVNNMLTVTFDIDSGGTMPTVAPVACTGSGIPTTISTATHYFVNNDLVEFTALGPGSTGVTVGAKYWVTASTPTQFRIIPDVGGSQVIPGTSEVSCNITAGSFIKLSRGIRAGMNYTAVAQNLFSGGPLTVRMFLATRGYQSGTFGSAIQLSSIGSNSYIIIHNINQYGTLFPLYGSTGRYLGAVGQAIPKRSATNMNSYKTGNEAIVTIDGQQVIPASPVQLENSFYGPFGACVAIDEDGQTVAVSSPSEGYNEFSTGEPPCEGAVYIYKKLVGEGGGTQWEQTNRITVPRVASYFGGLLGSVQHIQFGSSLEFAGSSLLVGSRQGVYIYELAVGLYGEIKTQEADDPQVGRPATNHKTSLSAAISFVSYIQVFSNINTSTRIAAELTGGSVLMLAAVATSTSISADLENPSTILIDSLVSTNTQFKPNLTIGAKLVLGSVRCESKCQIAANLTFTQLVVRSTITTGSSLGVIVTGGAGIKCEIKLGGSYSGDLSRFVNIPSTLTLSGAISVNDNLFRINPYLIESSTATATSIVANLGYVRVELSATLYKSTSIVVSAAKLVTLGTSDARQANIFEVGKASSATIGGLGQRWIKRSDLQNSDLTTSVEWVEGQPPQLD